MGFDKLTAFTVFSATFLAIISLVAYNSPELPFFDVMVDRHGRWRIPTNGGVTQIANAIIEAFPRIDNSFSPVDIKFDMDNEAYMQSNMMYIILFAIVGGIIMLVVLVILVARYCCNCCGGRDVRRKGYKESAINFYRYSIIIVSFVLEGILIYGYFANTDLHNAMSTLADSFENTSNQLLDQIKIIQLPIGQKFVEGVNTTVLSDDLQFSARYAKGQTAQMKGFLNSFETYRMVVIIANLISATLGCSLGIAAGSVRKGTPVLIMVILFAVSDFLFFLSLGVHFTGSKIIYEFCSEVKPYMQNEEVIPMRLQYFVPCVSSPIYPFIHDYFILDTLKKLDNFTSLVKADGKNFTEYSKSAKALGEDFDISLLEAGNTSDPQANETQPPGNETIPDEPEVSVPVSRPPQWFNISDPYYANFAKGNDAIQEAYTAAVESSKPMIILDQSTTCRWSKNELRLDSFLLCTYSKDNLDMIMLTQGAGSIVLLVLTVLGIPAIKRFKFAGNANLKGVLDANKGFMGKHAKAKR